MEILVAKPRVNGFMHKTDMPSKDFFSVVPLVTLVALVDQVISLEVLPFMDFLHVLSNICTAQYMMIKGHERFENVFANSHLE